MGVDIWTKRVQVVVVNEVRAIGRLLIIIIMKLGNYVEVVTSTAVGCSEFESP